MLYGNIVYTAIYASQGAQRYRGAAPLERSTNECFHPYVCAPAAQPQGLPVDDCALVALRRWSAYIRVEVCIGASLQWRCAPVALRPCGAYMAVYTILPSSIHSLLPKTSSFGQTSRLSAISCVFNFYCLVLA